MPLFVFRFITPVDLDTCEWILLASMETTKAPRFPDICLPFGEDKQCSVSAAVLANA